jgi:carbonic anhydrase/acetyltransferase-like protein (isoleucine patch superfamily)
MSLTAYQGRLPSVHPSAFIAPSADVIGDVEVGENASIWFGAVLRGDINRIVIGANSNVQDNAVVHLADEYPAIIGSFVTIGHSAVVHACVIEDECLIGMGAIILDGAVIGARSIVGAGALVTPGTIIPPGSMVLGSPAKVTRTLDEDRQLGLKHWAEKYVRVSREYLTSAIPPAQG